MALRSKLLSLLQHVLQHFASVGFVRIDPCAHTHANDRRSAHPHTGRGTKYGPEPYRRAKSRLWSALPPARYLHNLIFFVILFAWRLCDEDVSIGSPNKRSSSHTLHLHLQERGTCTTHLKNRFTLCRFLRGPWFLHGFPKGLSWRPTSVCSSTAAETLSLRSTD